MKNFTKQLTAKQVRNFMPPKSLPFCINIDTVMQRVHIAAQKGLNELEFDYEFDDASIKYLKKLGFNYHISCGTRKERHWFHYKYVSYTHGVVNWQDRKTYNNQWSAGSR
jgi:hypothetical protein